MKLYEINESIITAINNGDDIEDLVIEREEKILNVAKYIKSLEAEVKAMKDAESDIAERRKSKENKITSLKEYLTFNCSGEKFEDAQVSIAWRKSESIEFLDNFECPEQFQKKEVKIIVDKTAIKQAIKEGEEIKGVYIKSKNNVQIK